MFQAVIDTMFIERSRHGPYHNGTNNSMKETNANQRNKK